MRESEHDTSTLSGEQSHKKNGEERLLNKLIKKEAELQKLQRERILLEKKHNLVERNYKTITRSRYYKLSWPLRKSVSLAKKMWASIQKMMFGSTLIDLKEENAKLKNTIKKNQRELLVVKEKLKVNQNELVEKEKREMNLLLQLEHVTHDKLIEMVEKAAETGEMIECLKLLIRNRAVHDEKYSSALRQAAKLFLNKDEDMKHTVYELVLRGLKLEEIPEFIVRFSETETGFSLNHLASFKASLSLRARQRQLEDFMPESILDHKVNAYKFVDALGIKRPWVSTETYTLKEIPYKSGIVIKPFEGAGSRGVYLVHDANFIQDIKRSQTLNSWEELYVFMKADLDTKMVSEDKWIIEELILENKNENIPARDLKFYCFYGKVALILEIVRYPEVKYCWWNVDGERVDTGKYSDQLFEGKGITKAEIDLAKKISLEIPSPFSRIDFLKSEGILVFGEITPKPGHYDHFSDSMDQLLGEYYLEAEGRLVNDFLRGKQFNHYKSLDIKRS